MLNEMQLDEMLSRPSEALIREMGELEGDIMILGAGGKVGPTLSVMAKRACELSGKPRRVYAVSRFSDPFVVELMHREQVETITADLTDEAQVKQLPKVPNIIFMAGRKFGTSENACETWKMNVAVPDMIARHFGTVRYVVFSTGNVYPFADVESDGCTEDVSPEPIGEYGMSSLGRERIFEYAARHYGAKVLIYRLNYAVDLRYGVLYDLGERIMRGEPVSLSVPAFNCVWQGYANEVALRALKYASEKVEYLNVTGMGKTAVRQAAQALAEAVGKPVSFTGMESDKALLSNATKCTSWFGEPEWNVQQMIAMQAEWLLSGGRHLDKPTHFEEAKGKY